MLSLGVSLFPQTSLAIGLSLTPRNVSVWLAEQKRVQHTDYIQRWSLTRMLLFTECFETLPARLWLSVIAPTRLLTSFMPWPMRISQREISWRSWL